MKERAAPHYWVGQQVVASILVSGGYSRELTPYPLQASERTMLLEQVSELGIVGSTVPDPGDDPDDVAVSTFYPWSAVLYLRPQD